MSAVKIQIASQALLLLGEPGISAFNASPAGQTAGELYDFVRDTVLSCYPWFCTKRMRQLARLDAAPEAQWQYQFKLPKHIRILGAWPSANVGAGQLVDYDLGEDVLLANAPEVWLNFQFAAPEEQWPPYLRALQKYALAAELAMPITDQATKASYWNGKAWGTPAEGGKGGWYRTATTADAQGAPAQQIASFSLVEVRS
jgi:hypothetical protein